MTDGEQGKVSERCLYLGGVQSLTGLDSPHPFIFAEWIHQF